MPTASVDATRASVGSDAARQLLEYFRPDIDALLDPNAFAGKTIPAADQKVTRVIVAIHGIGDQVRDATALSTAIRFCDFHSYRSGIPLGAFQPPPGARPGLVIPSPPEADGFTGVTAFAEAHWADIARQVAKQGYTLQETKEWARSIVNRMGALAMQRNPANADIDYRRIHLVLDEMIDAIAVIESLLFIASKAGLGDFNFKELLDNYLGDVQVVTEFASVRAKIISRFVNTMAAVAAKYPNAELYVVAHSEGTVVSFLGLLEASDHPKDHDWIDRVSGYMTIGSPIDKHIILWPQLFTPHKGPHRALARPIPWRNYVDYSDPVGFDLDTARKWIQERGYSTVFDFTDKDDMSFYRYPIPGKAHIDYWGDPDVFGHFIREVIQNTARGNTPKPQTKRMATLASFIVAYLLPLLILGGGLYVLVAAIGDYYDPKDAAKHPNLFPTVGALTCLIGGATVWLRMVRLTRAWRWFLVGLGLYVAGAVGFFWTLSFIDPRAQVNELEWFERLSLLGGLPLGVTAFAASLLVIGLVLLGSLPRFKRSP